MIEIFIYVFCVNSCKFSWGYKNQDRKGSLAKQLIQLSQIETGCQSLHLLISRASG